MSLSNVMNFESIFMKAIQPLIPDISIAQPTKMRHRLTVHRYTEHRKRVFANFISEI